MKATLRCMISAVAVAVVLTTCSTAFAKSKKPDLSDSSNYVLLAEENNITVTSNLALPTTFRVENTELTLSVDAAGGVTAAFKTSGGNEKIVRLGKSVKTMTLCGIWQSVKVSDALNYRYTLNFNAVVENIIHDGAAKLVLHKDSVVNNLMANQEDASVVLEPGAQLNQSNKTADTFVYIDLRTRLHKTQITEAVYDAKTQQLYLTANAVGCSVQDALSDVVISVRQSNNKAAIAGRWYWPQYNGAATESGRYVYCFSPSDGMHQGVKLVIEFTAYQSQSVMA